MNKKIVYIDMDGVLADFDKAVKENKLTKKYGITDQDYDLIPDIFLNLEPMSGAYLAVNRLMNKYDVYVASSAPWSNPQSWTDKRRWIEKHFPKLHKRLILIHHKNLLRGDYLIDDRTKNGAAEFKGEHIHFGKEPFKDWGCVLNYLDSDIYN